MEIFSRRALKRKLWGEIYDGVSGYKKNKHGDTGGGNGGDNNGDNKGDDTSEWIVLIVLLMFLSCGSVCVCLMLVGVNIF